LLQALVFDLDDTLYLERDFVMSGYRAVARHLAASNQCSFESVLSTMMEILDAKGRHMVFPILMERFPDVSSSISELIDVYRQHTPAINLYPGYLELLRKLSRHYRLGVITDGLPAVQARKIRALGLRSVMDKIIYTWEYGSEKEKPHPLSFSLMLEFLRADPGSALYIGDNPEKDCRGAHGVGMKFVQVCPPASNGNGSGTAVHENPEFVIETLLQLPQILEHMN
jgi:putative hydrolase of the HAD superfamily